MTFQCVKKTLLYIWITFILASLIFFFVGGDQLDFASVDSGTEVKSTNDIGELITGKIIEQPFQFDATYIDSIEFAGTDYGHSVGGVLHLSILNASDELRAIDIDMGGFTGASSYTVQFDPPIEIQEREPLVLRLSVNDGSAGSVPTLYYGSSISLSRGEKQIVLNDESKLSIDGKKVDGVLCFVANGRRMLWFGAYYWYLALFVAIALAMYSGYVVIGYKKNKNLLLFRLVYVLKKYRFLLEQLVARDFKSKYKRSVLGILWSFLNPMLMMSVQYVVFSTIFKSDIENFAVYLLTGIVCYNFFSEVTNMALTSIVGNASLITKVYIPKYIYPFSRAVSSMINFLLSFIPLVVVMLFTQTKITFAVLLLPFAILCLFMLALGVGLLLSALMVFFRDTQFLWNVLNMVWMYMTPIFYPEDIISGWLSYIFKLNPLYHIIRFFRIVLLNGISPEPKAYLLCFISAVIPFILGTIVFRKTEDRFVLYI